MTRPDQSRRDFIKKTALFSSAVLLAPACATATSSKYKMGLQLYTIRDAMAENPIDTLRQVANMGYEDFEIYGFDPEKMSYYGFEAAEFKRILDDMGLSVSSGHYGLADYLDKPVEMKHYIDRSIEGAKALDSSYITWPWMPPEKRNLQTWQQLPEVLNQIGEQVTKAGLGFAYHNHGFEFEDFDGLNGYDIIMAETDPKLVKLQLDMYWSAHSSKVSTVDLIARDPERFVMWHIKDMDKVTRDYSELGNGSIDYHKVLKEASQEGLQYYYLEQGGNFATNSMQSITDSAAYFKKELKGYLGG